jgi:hypothetical protein
VIDTVYEIFLCVFCAVNIRCTEKFLLPCTFQYKFMISFNRLDKFSQYGYCHKRYKILPWRLIYMRVRRFSRNYSWLRHLCQSACLFKEKFRFNWRDFHEILYLIISQNSLHKIQVLLQPEKRMGTIRKKNLCKFMIIPLRILLRMGNISDNSCRENQSTFYVQYIFNNNLPLIK